MPPKNIQIAAHYSNRDLAIVIPTYNRPAKLGLILESIEQQQAACGRVVVVDGEDSAAGTVRSFAGRLPVEYHTCNPPGQIRQRNYGIALLDATTPLVAFFDDDIVLDPDALEKMIACWNTADPDTAGIGFNMVNVPRHRPSRIKSLFFLDHPRMGRVLKSGMNTDINHVPHDIRTQWLGGGYTVWRRDILEHYPQKTVNTRWAVGEDLRYSYPIGKQYPLYICSRARVHHHHVYDQARAAEVARYRGRKIVSTTIYFIMTNRELSLTGCYWMLVGLTLGRLLQGLRSGNRHNFKEACGQAEGLLDSLKYAFGQRRDLKRLLEDE